MNCAAWRFPDISSQKKNPRNDRSLVALWTVMLRLDLLWTSRQINKLLYFKESCSSFRLCSLLKHAVCTRSDPSNVKYFNASWIISNAGCICRCDHSSTVMLQETFSCDGHRNCIDCTIRSFALIWIFVLFLFCFLHDCNLRWISRCAFFFPFALFGSSFRPLWCVYSSFLPFETQGLYASLRFNKANEI